MNDRQPQYETMPKHYLLCFNDECKLADSCLHRLAARSGRQTEKVVTAVNPSQCSGPDCDYYKENKVATMAYGMVHSFHEVKADDIAALRNTLIDHFGRGSYYLRRNGLRAITPKEQQYIGSVFHKFGYEAKYDRTEEETLLALVQKACTDSTGMLYYQYKGFVPGVQTLCTKAK